MMALKHVTFLLCPNIEVWNCDDKAHSNSFMNTEFLRRVIFLLGTGWLPSVCQHYQHNLLKTSHKNSVKVCLICGDFSVECLNLIWPSIRMKLSKGNKCIARYLFCFIPAETGDSGLIYKRWKPGPEHTEDLMGNPQPWRHWKWNHSNAYSANHMG